MTNPNSTYLNVMIGRHWLLIWGSERYPVNVGCSNFRYTNNGQSNYSTKKTWEPWQWRSTLNSLNLQDWGFIIGWFVIVSETIVVGGVLPLCRDAVSVFCSSHRRSWYSIGITNVWFGLIWFYGISTFVGYLTPNPFLCK